jgi:hypothetical protein
MQNIPVYIIFFLIFYFYILFSTEPFIDKQNLKIIQKTYIIFKFSIMPVLICFAFVLSIIH